jgi:hypothetical protein
VLVVEVVDVDVLEVEVLDVDVLELDVLEVEVDGVGTPAPGARTREGSGEEAGAPVEVVVEDDASVAPAGGPVGGASPGTASGVAGSDGPSRSAPGGVRGPDGPGSAPPALPEAAEAAGEGEATSPRLAGPSPRGRGCGSGTSSPTLPRTDWATTCTREGRTPAAASPVLLASATATIEAGRIQRSGSMARRSTA